MDESADHDSGFLSRHIFFRFLAGANLRNT